MELFGADAWLNLPELSRLLARLGLDLLFVHGVVHQVYLRRYSNREFVFTFYLFNIITVCLCLLLRKVPTEVGFALALFGVFGILRYRTEQIRSRDLTYLFIVLGLGIVNGVAGRQISVAELLVVNLVIVSLTAALELSPRSRSHEPLTVSYDRIELLKPGTAAALHEDLALRTGLRVARVETQRIDLVRDCAELHVFWEP